MINVTFHTVTGRTITMTVPENAYHHLTSLFETDPRAIYVINTGAGRTIRIALAHVVMLEGQAN